MTNVLTTGDKAVDLADGLAESVSLWKTPNGKTHNETHTNINVTKSIHIPLYRRHIHTRTHTHTQRRERRIHRIRTYRTMCAKKEH